MTNTNQLIEAQTEAAVVADIASRAVEPHELTIVEDSLLGIVVDGQLHQIDITKYQPTPQRQAGRTTFTERDSFANFINRHKSESGTTVWSNVDDGTMTAVLNDHIEGIEESGWGDHRATLQLKQTDDWKFWLSRDGKYMGQTDFAEFLQEGANSIVDPDAATMLEIASSFQARSGATFKSQVRLESGEVRFAYEEQVSATAGSTSGTLEIPTEFTLKLQPFDGGPEYDDIQARFRYRINQGQLALSYKLIRPDLVKRKAFNDITSGVSDQVGLDIYAGTPRS